MKSLGFGLALLLAISAETPAHARDLDRVLVGSLKLNGAKLADPAPQAQARTSLTGGLAAAGFAVVPEADVARALAGSTGLANCDTVACLARLAELVGVRWAVRAELESVGDNWNMKIELIDARATANEPTRVADSCEVCNVSDANEKLSKLAASLRSKLEPTIAAPRPPAPLQPPTPPREVTRLWRTGGYAGLGVGSLSLVAGIVLLALDGGERGHHFYGGFYVRERYDTVAPGAVLTVAGVALVGGGVFALWHERALQRSVTVAPAISTKSAGLFLDARF